MESKLQAMATKSNASRECFGYNTPNENTVYIKWKEKNICYTFKPNCSRHHSKYHEMYLCTCFILLFCINLTHAQVSSWKSAHLNIHTPGYRMYRYWRYLFVFHCLFMNTVHVYIYCTTSNTFNNPIVHRSNAQIQYSISSITFFFFMIYSYVFKTKRCHICGSQGAA